MLKKCTLTILIFALFFLFFTGAAGAATLSLSNGWNLVGTKIEITAGEKFSESSAFSSVWKWENSNWAVYLPGEASPGEYAAAKGFGNLSTISPGEGFWVNSKGSQEVTIEGTETSSDSITVVSGWNLKALTSSTSINVNSLFSDSNKFASIWKWTGSNWSVYLPGQNTQTYATAKGFSVLSTISPGEGFWVNASTATDVVAEPPVIAGSVSYPKEETSATKIALYKAGLLSEVPEVEMPPTPGVSVKVYAADDNNYENPLAETTTDEDGNYSFGESDFDDPETPDVETPPEVPVMVRAEFQSPINPTNQVAVAALVDPSDETKKAVVKVNPLTTAIAQKIETFIEDTFQISVTKEIMTAAKTFIDMIATQVEDKGLTYFEEEDVKIGEYKEEAPEELKEDFVATASNLADKVIDKATGGLMDSMESHLIEKAETAPTTLGTNIQIDATKKLEHFVKFFVSLGFAVQAAPEDGADSQKVIIFLPTPPFIPDNQIPGNSMFDDRAFRMIDPAVDLTQEKLNSIDDPGLIFQIKKTLMESPFMSSAAVQAIAQVAAGGGTTTLTKMAAVVKNKFEWKTEGVQMINGIPMFSDQMQTPKTGADVTASTLISKLTGKLGDTPKDVAGDIASKPYYIVDLADEVINQKINTIYEDPGITDKQAAIDTFFKGIQSFDDLKVLVQSSEEFQREVEQISRRIFAAFEPDLYGKVLSASTQLKTKTAFVLMNLMVDRDYLIDETAGWYKTYTEGDNTWIEPNFGNRKWLHPKEENPNMVSQIVGQLIGTEITDGANFNSMVQALHIAAENIQDPNMYKMDAEMIQNVANVTMSDQVTVSGKVKNYDGTEMGSMQVYLMYFDNSGTIQNFPAEAEEALKMTTNAEGQFEFTNVPAGHPYEVHFVGNDFIFPFFVDGFIPNTDLGEIWLPPPGGMGGAMGFPGVSLWIDEYFFNPMDPQDENNGKMDGVDFSNFNTEKPFIVFQGSDQGTPDLFWTSQDGLTVNPTALLSGQGAAIASLGEGQDHQHGLGSGPVLDHVFSKGELEGTAAITMDNATFTLDWVDSIAEPDEDNAVYVVKDSAGNYFFIEVHWWDKDIEGNPNGMIDMGFAKLGSDGRLDVPKEDFIGGPPVGANGDSGPMVNMFVNMCVGDYFDLETGMFSPPAQEPFGYNAQVAEEADIRWLAGFYDTYWANEDNWDTRNAYLSKSDRAISVINNASLSKVTLEGNSVTITEVAEGKVTDVVPGTMLLIETEDQGSYILGVNWVEKDAIGLMVVQKDEMIDSEGNLLPGIQDGDSDGIPNVLDDNDFMADSYDETWAQDQFKMVDADGDGVSAEFDPNDNDPNVPFSGGDKDMDGDGLLGGADPNDNNPNDPVMNGNWDDDQDGWPKAIDPNDQDNTVPGDEGDFFGGGKKEDMDGDGIPSDMDTDDNNPNDPVMNGNLDEDGDGFTKGSENYPNMGTPEYMNPDLDLDPNAFPGSFNAAEATITTNGTAKVAIVWLKEDYPGAPPYWEFMSIWALDGVELTVDDGKYSVADITPADIIAAIPAGWPQFGLNDTRAEIVLVDDMENNKNGPQFDFYQGGDETAGIAVGYELQMVGGTWQLNELKPGTGPQKVDEGTDLTISFGPKF